MKKNKEKKNKIEFPDNFFNIPRPKISMKETLKDVTPIKWTNKKNEEVIVYSKNRKNILKTNQND